LIQYSGFFGSQITTGLNCMGITQLRWYASYTGELILMRKGNP
jgi:hypothetical protein